MGAPADRAADGRYFIEAAARVLDVLESFDREDEALSTSEVARRVGIPYTSAVRLLYTLERRGYVYRPAGSKKFTQAPARKRYRIGYAGLDECTVFSRTVSHSLTVAARRADIELIGRNNELSPQKALTNVDILLGDRINLLVIYQRDEVVANVIAAKCRAANVPMIAVNFAHADAYYYGANNYAAGRLAGEYLASYADAKWDGQFDRILILSARGFGSAHESRRRGMLDSLADRFGESHLDKLTEAPAGVTPRDGYSAVQALLSDGRTVSLRVLVGALSDFLGVGAGRAVARTDMTDSTAIVGIGAARDVRSIISRGGAFRASVAFFPETYGDGIISLALRILAREEPPLVTYTNHAVLTFDTLRNFYPD